MNCKPGDLAVVVRNTTPEGRRAIGRIIRVTGILEASGDPLWCFEPVTDNFLFAYDSCLRPIRDPGDDARDETLSWLPTPSQHKEVA